VIWVLVALAGIFVLFIVGTLGAGLLVYKASTSSEADAQAKRYWDKEVKRCGDRYFVLARSWGGVATYTEYKGFSYAVVGEGLTDADKLNGYEWKGSTGAHFNSYRQFSGSGRRWSEWKDGGSAFYNGVGSSTELSKINGQWYYGFEHFRQEASKAVFPQIECAGMPQ